MAKNSASKKKWQTLKKWPTFVRTSHRVIRPFVRSAEPLQDFLAKVRPLTLQQRAAIVDQAILLLEGFYAHLPLKRAMYAVDPLNRLRLLRHRLPALEDELAFHLEMADIFISLRDRHTVYLMPEPLDGAYAWLPFRVEACVDDGDRKYLVTRVLKGVNRKSFCSGVEVVSWNGVPIRRAVEVAGARSGGSNPAACHANGLERLTTRFLGAAPPPDESSVIVEYRTFRGRLREEPFDWMVSTNPPPLGPRAALPHGISIESNHVQHINKAFYAPNVLEKRGRRTRAAQEGEEIASNLPEIFVAKLTLTSYGNFGYIRIRTFDTEDIDRFVAEFNRLVALLPENGLIIDVRDNPGGRIWAAERLLQTFTSRRIEPEPVQLINSPYTLQLCRLQASNETFGRKGLKPWIKSIRRSLATNAAYSTSFPYSACFPYSSPDDCNNVGQTYHGRVVLVTNALSYSATEFFAAGFQDHGIGKILGTDDATGAGGGSVRSHAELRQYFSKASHNPLKKLPRQVDMTVAWCRSLRVGPQAGMEVEDFGITPDEIHDMTRNDLLHQNVDLIKCAAGLLARNKRRGRKLAKSRRAG